MGQSITWFRGMEMPSWARYSVQICHSATLANRPDVFDEPEQLFSSRVDAERFAFAASEHFIAAESPDRLSPMWALVNALAATNATRVSYGARHCYLSIDARRKVVKRHDINRGYFGARCIRCEQPTEAI